MVRFSRWAMIGVIAGLCGLAQPARAVDIKIGDDTTFLKFGLLMQTWGAFIEAGAPAALSATNADKDAWSADFYLRRVRLLFSGQASEKINFFIETDSPNLGKQSDYTVRTSIQDAWVELNLCESFQLDVGELLVPFSHTGMTGATSLHSIDYHSALIKFPTGTNLVWRDMGVMARGLLLNQLLEYRVAIVSGVHGTAWDLSGAAPKGDPRNINDMPRLVARLTANLFDAEGVPALAGFFYKGIYLKKTDDGITSPKKILSVGISADWQKDLNVKLNADNTVNSRADYLAIAADLFWDLPLDEKKLMGLVGQVDFFFYDHGDRRTQDDGTRSFYDTDAKKYLGEYTGFGFLSELGFRYDAFELMASVDLFNSTKAAGDTGDYLSIYGGFNWWWLAHNTAFKVQFGRTKKNGADFYSEAYLQAQLLF
jgi:hypothetical protein